MATLVGPAPLQSRWLDFGDAGRTLDWYRQAQTAGYDGVILDCITPGTQQDCAYARQAGLAVMAFQGYYPPAFQDLAQATSRAQQALQWAQQTGYPTGAMIWLDWESADVSPAFGVQWINQWATVVQQGGYVPGIYVGAPQPLDATTLYYALIVQHYWKSLSQVPPVAVRGYQLVQVSDSTDLAGLACDADVVTGDALGGMPLCWLPDPSVDRVAQLEAQLQQVHSQLAQAQSTIQTLQGKIQNALKALS